MQALLRIRHLLFFPGAKRVKHWVNQQFPKLSHTLVLHCVFHTDSMPTILPLVKRILQSVELKTATMSCLQAWFARFVMGKINISWTQFTENWLFAHISGECRNWGNQFFHCVAFDYTVLRKHVCWLFFRSTLSFFDVSKCN